jgi:hypothetical protein
MPITTEGFPSEALAYREYALALSNGSRITMAITLGDPKANTMPGRFARKHRALAYGLVSVLDMPDAPKSPIIWMIRTDQLILAKSTNDDDIPEELKKLIGLYLRLFFVQTAPSAPQLAGIEIASVAVANDNHTVH